MKKLLAIILCLIIVFSFSACGNKSNPTQNQAQTEVQKPKTEINVTKKQVQKIINGEFTTPKNRICASGATPRITPSPTVVLFPAAIPLT